MVSRIDSSREILSHEIAADGSIRATADVARCGIYLYSNADGGVTRELVLPEHLFDPESLKTLASVAVTIEHPPVAVTPENAQQYAVGNVHETIEAVEAESEQDFGYVRVRLTGRTADAVRKLTQGKIYTSPRYSLPKYDATPGEHPMWGHYDAIQGPRIYNHVALTDFPRGGDKMLVHMDSTDVAGAVDEEKWAKAKTLAADQGHGEDYAYIMGIYKQMGGDSRRDSQGKKMSETIVRLDTIGREVSVGETAAEVLRQELAALNKSRKDAVDKVAELEAKYNEYKKMADEAKAELEKLQGTADAATAAEKAASDRAAAAEAVLRDTHKIREILMPRLEMEAKAKEFLPKDQHDKIDSMTDDELRAGVVSVLLPSLKTEGITGDRLDGMYQVAIATRQTRQDSEPPKKDDKAPTGGAKQTEDEIHKARLDAEYIPPRRAGLK